MEKKIELMPFSLDKMYKCYDNMANTTLVGQIAGSIFDGVIELSRSNSNVLCVINRTGTLR